jgi:transketolase
MDLNLKSINTIRALGIDAINKANSGHPGMVLGAAPMAYTLFTRHLNVDVEDSKWINRDRFILAAGHGSMLLYSLLHLSGFDVSIEDIKNFRQWGSKTPGHPEYGHTHGVDATSGPLGQGIAMAVGMAISEDYLAGKYNDGVKIFDHYTYALCGDGDLQEGVTQEALSLAGNLGLEKLIVLYDSNDIQLDGPVHLANKEDVKAKFESMNWDYSLVEDGNDIEAIDQAIIAAKASDKPSVIEIKTEIGFGSPVVGTSKAHGAPLGQENGEVTKENLNWEYPEFYVPDAVYEDFETNVRLRGTEVKKSWNKEVMTYFEQNEEVAAELINIMNDKEFDYQYDELISEFKAGEMIATRAVSGKALNHFSNIIPNVVGGSADVCGSTKAVGINGDYSKANRTGQNINFGVREHAMAALLNGMTLHGGLKAFGGAFFVFSDYCKPSIRMAALMNIPSIFVFSHDSIAVGEDGPTHEPVEQLAGLRSIPNHDLIRPADAVETCAAWRLALEANNHPSTIVLTRQAVRNQEHSSYDGVSKGAYVISKESSKLDGIILASGSEVTLAVEVQEALLNAGIDVRVVSVPSMYRFDMQTAEYKDEVIPSTCRKRVSLEMGSTMPWYKYVGLDGLALGIDQFGASAPASKVIEEYGFNTETVTDKLKAYFN